MDTFRRGRLMDGCPNCIDRLATPKAIDQEGRTTRAYYVCVGCRGRWFTSWDTSHWDVDDRFLGALPTIADLLDKALADLLNPPTAA